MAEPLLDTGDVGPVVEGVGCGGGPQDMGTEKFHLDAEPLGVVHDHVAINRSRQEALVRVCQAWERGEVQSPKAFLFATARNLALDQVRRQKIVPMISLVETDTQAVLEEGASIPDLVARNQELEFLTEVIQLLPDRCRQVFTLRKAYGMSQKEIAAQLGISEHTVSAQLTIALHKCTAHFARYRRERGGRT